MIRQNKSYLALDTSGGSFRVCAVKDGEAFARTSNSGSDRAPLTALVSGALNDANLDIKSLAGIAVSTGPGSFTGLRVGLAFAKAIALAREIPLLGISSFEQALDSDALKRSGPVDLLLIHMKAESYYVYEPRGLDSFDPERIRVAEITEIAEIGPGGMIGEGGASAVGLYCFVDSPAPEAFLATGEDVALTVALEIADLARLASERFGRNESVDWRRIEPIYAQRSNAEINFDTRQRKQTDVG